MAIRGNGMGNVVGRRSPVRRVSEFMVKMGGRMPSREELKAIEPDLNELWNRVQSVRAKYPQGSIGWSEQIQQYFVLMGKEVATKRPGRFRRAASLL